jgi:hypothetical protein
MLPDAMPWKLLASLKSTLFVESYNEQGLLHSGQYPAAVSVRLISPAISNIIMRNENHYWTD